VAVVFTLDELWAMHAFIRHEMPQQETWKFPPASVTLNDDVCEAIVFCEDNKERDASLVLTRGDLLCIDYNVRADVKTPGGAPLGKSILMKTFRARNELRNEPLLEADPGCDKTLDQREIDEAVEKSQIKATRRARRPKKE
jgi:hypothetical protein